MNREVKLALILVVVILGGSIITFFRHYTALDPVERLSAALSENPMTSSTQVQQELEKHLLCTISTDTGACSCRDKHDDTVVSVSPERCIHYVDRQVASNQLTR